MPNETKNPLLPLAATALAWLVPGAGHVVVGRPLRGAVIFLTIAATFWAGVAMGGVMTVDPVNERWWFLAEMVTGVHGLAAWKLEQATYRKCEQELATDRDFRQLADRYRPGPALEELKQRYIDQILARDRIALVSPMDTVARAYSGVAGLLNLMCIFDAAMLALMGVRGENARVAAGRKETPQP